MNFFIVMFTFMFFGLVNVSLSYSYDKQLFDKYDKECRDGNLESCKIIGLTYFDDKGMPIGQKKELRFLEKNCSVRSEDGCKVYKIIYDDDVDK